LFVEEGSPTALAWGSSQAFDKMQNGIPGNVDPKHKTKDHGEKKWKKILQEMIEGFEIVAQDKVVVTAEDEKKTLKALRHFSKYFNNLWD